MNQSKISVRYAKALFHLAKDNNSLPAVMDDIKLILDTAKIQELAEFINSPILNSTEKRKAINAIFENKISKHSLSFLNLVLENKRENYLNDIARNFIYMYKTDQGIKSVVFTTPVAIDETLRNNIINLVSTVFSTKVELKERIKEDLLGGYILRIDDNQIDDSISGKLKKYKRELINTSFEKKIN
ncbi:MAG: ATP synthase F1 subunit delta [Bacteroidales bacterium]|nr:ATP synthase F1 subunit delta [Bacteroidales bacterium]